MKPKSEAELAAVAHTWLRSRGLEVFQEVEVKSGRIDLVGRGRRLVVAVEAKLTFGLDVLNQARRWCDDASESWVAVPWFSPPRLDWQPHVSFEYCSLVGIGILGVLLFGPPAAPESKVVLEARRTDPKGLTERWRKRLHPDQKTAARAGTNGGGYSTRFGRFCKELVQFVGTNPGVTLGDVERALEHPFSGRRSFLSLMPSKLAVGRHRDPRLADVRLEGNGVKARLWPTAGDVAGGVF